MSLQSALLIDVALLVVTLAVAFKLRGPRL